MDLLKLLQDMEARIKQLENQRPISKTTYMEIGSVPATPDTGNVVLYFKTDDKLYYKLDDGTVKEVVTV